MKRTNRGEGEKHEEKHFCQAAKTESNLVLESTAFIDKSNCEEYKIAEDKEAKRETNQNHTN